MEEARSPQDPRRWLLPRLAVVSVGSVLAMVVLVEKVLRSQALGSGLVGSHGQKLSIAAHLGNLLDDGGAVDGCRGILAPAERPMIANEAARVGDGVDALPPSRSPPG